VKKLLGCVVTALIILGVVAPVSHTAVLADLDDFAGGDGSAGNPYQIADWNHLDNVRHHLYSHFILMHDLDADTDGYATLAGDAANGGKGWQPLRAPELIFNGTFDGQGYEIRDLFIDRDDEDCIGLFGMSDSPAIIEAVGVVNADITGRDSVGALVGANWGTVSNCCATGSVTGSYGVGGLVADNPGTLTRCYCTGSVSGVDLIGGLVGTAIGGTVTCCYASGSVTGEWFVGGLVGYIDEATVINCYATGGASGNTHVGGLVGDMTSGTISNSYATGNVNGGDLLGGLLGSMIGGTVTSCFWDTEASGMATSEGGTGKNTEAMQDIATYREQGTEGLNWPWDILPVDEGATLPYATWNIADGVDYPFLTFRRVEVEVKAGWNMVSAPGGLADSANTVAEVFGNQIVAIYFWNPVTKSYNVPTVLEPNQGYWVAVTEDKTLIMRI